MARSHGTRIEGRREPQQDSMRSVERTGGVRSPSRPWRTTPARRRPGRRPGYRDRTAVGTVLGASEPRAQDGRNELGRDRRGRVHAMGDAVCFDATRRTAQGPAAVSVSIRERIDCIGEDRIRCPEGLAPRCAALASGMSSQGGAQPPLCRNMPDNLHSRARGSHYDRPRSRASALGPPP